MSESDDKGQILTIKVPVFPATDEARDLALNGIKSWRATCTQASAALAAIELATSNMDVDKEGNIFVAPEDYEKNKPITSIQGSGRKETC